MPQFAYIVFVWTNPDNEYDDDLDCILRFKKKKAAMAFLRTQSRVLLSFHKFRVPEDHV